MGGGVRGGARGGRGGARKEPVKSKEDLDAEMDVYMSSLIVKKLKYLKLAWPGQGNNLHSLLCTSPINPSIYPSILTLEDLIKRSKQSLLLSKS